MSARSILLRVVLSIALVLYGATGAYAAIGMQMSAAPISTGQAMEQAADVGAAAEKTAIYTPCHQPSGMAHTSPATDPIPEPSRHPSPDCCKSPGCTCMCVQGVQAPPDYTVVLPALVNHSLSVRPLSLGHSSPALPHPTRPPIG